MSTLNWETIDQNYPVAGRDNDTQGFRDNFNIIKDALNVAETDLTTLQNDTVKNNAANNFIGNSIIDADLQATTEKYFGSGALSSSTNVNFTNGHFQNIPIVPASSITLTLAEWPLGEAGGVGGADRYAKITLQMKLNASGDAASVTLATPGGTLYTDGTMTNTISITSDANVKLVEVWTYNGGVDVYARYIGEFSAV
jgi:hypothetical protein